MFAPILPFIWHLLLKKLPFIISVFSQTAVIALQSAGKTVSEYCQTDDKAIQIQFAWIKHHFINISYILDLYFLCLFLFFSLLDGLPQTTLKKPSKTIEKSNIVDTSIQYTYLLSAIELEN